MINAKSGVRVLSLGEIASEIRNLYLSVAACTTVYPDSVLRYVLHVAGKLGNHNTTILHLTLTVDLVCYS